MHFNNSFFSSKGPDGGKFDYVILENDMGTRIKCLFSKFLDDGDYELGIDCMEIAKVA